MKNKNYDPTNGLLVEFNNAYTHTPFGHDSTEFSSESNIMSSNIPTSVVVDSWKLNLRKEPNFSSLIISVLNKGTELNVISDTGGEFYEVKTKSGITGYACKEFLK